MINESFWANLELLQLIEVHWWWAIRRPLGTPIMLIVESRMVDNFWAQGRISFKHRSLWCPFFNLHLPTHHSHIGVMLTNSGPLILMNDLVDCNVQWCPDRASVFGSWADDGLLNVWDYEKVRVFSLILVCLQLVLLWVLTFQVPVSCTFEIALLVCEESSLNNYVPRHFNIKSKSCQVVSNVV